MREASSGNIKTLVIVSFFSSGLTNMLYVIWQPFVLSIVSSMKFVGFLNAIMDWRGIATTASQLVGGYTSDKTGRKSIMVIGHFAIVIGFILCLVSAKLKLPYILVLTAIAFGISGLFWPVRDSIISESVKEQNLPFVYSLVSLSIGASGIFMPFLGGRAADKIGFNFIFIISIFIGILCVLYLMKFLTETLQREKRAGNRHISSQNIWNILKPGTRELRIFYLVMSLEMFVWGLGESILFGMLNKVYSYSNFQLGILISIISLSRFVFQLPCGKLVEKKGSKITLFLSELAGMISIAGVLKFRSFPAVCLLQVMYGLSIALWVPSTRIILANSIDTTQRGKIFGQFSFYGGVIGFPAPIIGGILFDKFGFTIPILMNFIGSVIVAIFILLFIQESKTNTKRGQAHQIESGQV